MKIKINPVFVFMKFWKYVGILALVSCFIMALFMKVGSSEVTNRKFTLIEKTGSGTERNFYLEDVETGNHINLFPTERWFNSAKVGEVIYRETAEDRFLEYGWLLGFKVISLIVVIITFAVWICIFLDWYEKKGGARIINKNFEFEISKENIKRIPSFLLGVLILTWKKIK